MRPMPLPDPSATLIGDVVSGGLLDKIENTVVALIILGPVLGMFCPPEGYLTLHSYQVTSASYETDYPITSLISRMTYVAILFLVIRNWRVYIRELKFAVFAIILFGFYISSSLWSEEPATTFKQSLHYYEYTILGIHLLAKYSSERLLFLLFKLLIIMTATSLLIMVFLPTFGHSGDLAGYQDTWRGCTNNKNALGMICVLAIFISVYALTRTKTNHLVCWLMLPANLLLLYKSWSMTSILGLGLCGLIGFAFIASRTRVGRLAVVSAVVSGTVIVLALAVSGVTLTELVGRSTTFTGRTDVWAQVIPLISHRPLLGYGIGFWAFLARNKANVWGALGWATPHAHNDYLDLTLQIGLIGASIAVINNFRAITQGLYAFFHGRSDALVYSMILIFFMIRGFSETLSVFPGTNMMLLVVVCQMRLWKSYLEERDSRRKIWPPHATKFRRPSLFAG